MKKIIVLTILGVIMGCSSSESESTYELTDAEHEQLTEFNNTGTDIKF